MLEVGGRGRNRHHVRVFGEWGWGRFMVDARGTGRVKDHVTDWR